MTPGTPHAILTRHFLRRFLETDLVAPEADRSQFIALVGAACFCSTVFITVIVSSFKYVAVSLTPGQAAVLSLDDKFFYIGLSMLVAALVAVSQWDALALDARDVAILEPLPLRPFTLRRAKLSAVAILGTATALVLNLAPSVVFPMLLLVKQRVSLPGAGWMIVTHAVVTMAAAVFGYMTVIATREGLAALVGPRLFARLSHVLQGVLVVALGSALLLLPGASRGVERRALAGSVLASPPAWFLGAYEVMAGGVLIDAPRGRLVPRLADADLRATAAYRARGPQFTALAGVAASALSFVFAAAALAYAWNARWRPQMAPPPAPAARRRWRLLRRLERMLTSSDETVRAGFYFTLAVLWRSRVHRLTLASAAAVGIAASFGALSGLDLEEIARNQRAVPRLLVAQPLLFGALLIGFRHAIRFPAELPANWGIQIGWRGRMRAFVAGARRAAVVVLVLPSLAVVFPLVALLLGPQAALAHAALGLAGAMAVLELLLVTYNKVPFACTYVPDEHLKALAPVYVGLFLTGASIYARIESAALGAPGVVVRVMIALAVVVAVARFMTSCVLRPGAVEFDEAPPRTQQLGLHT